MTGLGGPSPSLSLVAVENDGTPLSESPQRCGVFGVSPGEGHPISQDGSKIFFESEWQQNEECGQSIFARVDGSSTVQLNTPSNAECTTSACVHSRGEPAGETGSSANGSEFFFTSGQQLTNNATQGEPGPEDEHRGSEAECKQVKLTNGCNLYEYDFERPAGHNLIDITAEKDSSGLGPQVHDVVQVSPDGSHIYFTAGGVLTGEPNGLGETPVAGAENLYGYDTVTGTTKFIATVCSTFAENHGKIPPDPQCPGVSGEASADESIFSIEFSRLAQHSDVTPDGRFLVFASYARLTPDDTNKARDVYRYDFQTGSLIRLSTGHDGEDGNGNGGGQDANVAPPGGLLKGPESSVISDNGETVAFTTARALQGTDSSGNQEIYGWHQGEVSLISGGEDPIESRSPFVTPSGRDIFFSTTQGLLPQDKDHITDAYDARVDGGFPPPQAAPPICEGAEACHGAPGSEPSVPTLGTETFVGHSNPKEERTTKCKKGYVRKHRKCVKKHINRTKAHRKSHKPHRKSHKRVNHLRGGGK